jgi:hypothetical protein
MTAATFYNATDTDPNTWNVAVAAAHSSNRARIALVSDSLAEH